MKIQIKPRSLSASQSYSPEFPRQDLCNNVVCARRSMVKVQALQVRPYTTRKGDTIEIIADKRGFLVEEILKLNHSTDMSSLEEGMTILVPAEKLSDRDKEIIGGIGRKYRTYPVRKGETIDDIISKRNITMEEMKKLNPDVNFDKLKENMILKLPAGKYTVRETEMLMGVVRVPSEYFQNKGFMLPSTVIGIAALISLYVWWKGRTNKND